MPPFTPHRLHSIRSGLTRRLAALRRSEDGAVTVDWVVITASMMALTIAIMTAIAGGTETATTTISGTIASQSPARAW